MRHGWNAVSYQILNRGMRWWFSPAGDAVVGFARHDRVRVVCGAPVCAADRIEEVAGEFERDAAAASDRVVFFGAGARLEQVYLARRDHSLVKIGAQPVWDPREWPAIVAAHASLRAQLNRARNKGVRVREWPAAEARHAPALDAVLQEWLATRGLPPLAFMVTPYLLDALDDRRVFVAERGGDVVAYLVATPVPARNGWLVEEWPRSRRAPNGTTQLLVDAAMRAFAEAGCAYATLGLAPLSRRGDDAAGTQPPWLRLLLRWVRAHGRRFYNFAGLEAFKSALQPRAWEPIYAIAPGPHHTPPMLHAIASAFAGGSPAWLVLRAVGGSIREELRRVRRRLSR
jgi:phosphatidylglycerol lysyltransferase